MDEAVFWLLLSLLNWDATGNDDAVVAPVVEELSKKSVEEIHAFRDVLAEKLYLLDTKGHAKEIGEGSFTEEGYFSVDQFLYARCVVVANGKDLYETVLKSPSSFPKDMEFEALLYIVHAAYEKKTGLQYDGVTKLSYETFSNEAGWR